jgi:uncharacterized protein with PIN domain
MSATCNLCGYEVEFGCDEKKVVEEIGDLCRKCNTPVILRETKKFHKDGKPRKITYSHYLFCTNCITFYYNNKYRI